MLLEVCDLEASYGAIQVLWGVSLVVREGETVALIGPNGAGKTSLLRSIMGCLVRRKAGDIRFMGKSIFGLETHAISRAGIAMVPEEKGIFEGMTVMENLLLGAFNVTDRREVRESLDFVMGLFPRLGERRNQLAGTLSGGERQMLAIGRALMAKPRLLLLDEPSWGLAPKVASLVSATIRRLSKGKITVFVVEQNVHNALAIADRAYVLEHGRVVREGSSRDLLGDDHVRRTYLGVAGEA